MYLPDSHAFGTVIRNRTNKAFDDPNLSDSGVDTIDIIAQGPSEWVYLNRSSRFQNRRYAMGGGPGGLIENLKHYITGIWNWKSWLIKDDTKIDIILDHIQRDGLALSDYLLCIITLNVYIIGRPINRIVSFQTTLFEQHV